MLVAPLLTNPFISLAGANIVCDGNSITAILGSPGAGATWGGDISDPFPVQLLSALSPTYNGVTVTNFGVGGQSTASMIADAVVQIDPLISPLRPNILTMWEITNQVHGSSTVAQIYSLTEQYCTARRAAGWRVIVFTSVPREGSLGGRTIAQFNQRLNDVDALIRAGWRTWADALFDVRSRVPEVAVMNTTYFLPDKVHLNALGHAKLTAALLPVLKRIPRKR